MDIVPKAPKTIERKSITSTLTMLSLLVITVFLLATVGYPKFKTIPEKQAQFEELKSKNQLLDEKLKKLNDLTDFKDVVKEDSDLVDSALPSEPQIPLLLTQVQQIAKEAGLEVTNLSYSASSKSKGTGEGEVFVLLGANGSFSEIRNFLINLEQAARIIDISTLRFSSDRGTDPEQLGSSEVEASFGLTSSFLAVDSKAVTEEPITVDIRDSKFVSFINKLKTLKIYKTEVDNQNIGKENPFTP